MGTGGPVKGFQHDDKGSKQTRKASSGLSRLSKEIIQTSQQMKEKRLRSETAQKIREETEVRKANKQIATITALSVVQQVPEAQKVRQEEHDVDHMTEQRHDQIIQEQAMTSQSHPSHAAGGACWRGGRRVAVRRQEQLGVSSSGAKDLPQGLEEDIREQRPDATLDVLAAGNSTSTGGAQDSNRNRLHQTCRPVDQFEHVCVEECPLITRHAAKRSGDSCGESHRASAGLQPGGGSGESQTTIASVPRLIT